MTINGKYLCEGYGEHFNAEELNEDGFCELCADDEFEQKLKALGVQQNQIELAMKHHQGDVALSSVLPQNMFGCGNGAHQTLYH
jgi:hypothetical protein